RPVLVGWSYGGGGIGGFFTNHCAAGPAGLDYVRLVSKTDPRFFCDGQHRGDGQLPPQLLREAPTQGESPRPPVNMIARTDTRAFRCCPCARTATAQKMGAPEMEVRVR